MKHNLFSAILWSLASAIWAVLAIDKIVQKAPIWSIVVNVLVVVLSIANADTDFTRYKKSK